MGALAPRAAGGLRRRRASSAVINCSCSSSPRATLPAATPAAAPPPPPWTTSANDGAFTCIDAWIASARRWRSSTARAFSFVRFLREPPFQSRPSTERSSARVDTSRSSAASTSSLAATPPGAAAAAVAAALGALRDERRERGQRLLGARRLVEGVEERGALHHRERARVHRLLLAARLEADVAGDDAHVARELALHVRHLLRDHVVRRLPPPREGHREPELPQVVGGGARAVVDDEDDAAVEVAVLGPPRRLAEQLLVPQREAALAAHVLDVDQHHAVRGLEAD